MSETTTTSQRIDEVQRYYRDKARTAVTRTPCCGASPDVAFGAAAYQGIGPDDAPNSALLASLGCGNPIAVAELRPGETVVDLGSGGGLDLILSAHRVGPDGLVYGVDFLEEMLALARRNIIEAGLETIILLKGSIEAIPLPADTVDVAISNCVINLAVDKPAVFAEIFRVLAPGGRLGISDVVAEDRLSPAERAARGTHAECVAGALSVSEYTTMLSAAGLVDVEVTFTQLAADDMHTAIVRARKPTVPAGADDTPPVRRHDRVMAR
ncbi:MAG: methyltransferase domain-containing protein [Pseudonocardiaceae bacterium]